VVVKTEHSNFAVELVPSVLLDSTVQSHLIPSTRVGSMRAQLRSTTMLARQGLKTAAVRNAATLSMTAVVGKMAPISSAARLSTHVA